MVMFKEKLRNNNDVHIATISFIICPSTVDYTFSENFTTVNLKRLFRADCLSGSKPARGRYDDCA